MASTASSIIESAWSILRTSGASTDVPALQEAFMLTLCNQANAEWIRAFRRGSGAGPSTFQQETGFTLVAETSVNQTTIAAGATSFVATLLDNFDLTNGSAVLWNQVMPDVFQYTTATVATETFSGVTGINFTHSSGDAIQKLYKLPTNFRSFRPSEFYGDGVQLNGMPLRYMNSPPSYGYFSMIDDGTNKWLWLPRQVTGKASVQYEKNSTTITSTSDTVDVPVDSEMFLVWRVVQAASIPKNGGQPSQLYAVAKNAANLILLDALNDRNTGNSVRVKQFSILRPYRDSSLFLSSPRT